MYAAHQLSSEEAFSILHQQKKLFLNTINIQPQTVDVQIPHF
jgi:hypothetical protein